MRLIDADEFKRQIAAVAIKDNISKSVDKANVLFDLIDLQPTVYDVEKVVQQLEEIGKNFCVSVHCNDECQDCEHGAIMRSLIEIVRSNGEKE